MGICVSITREIFGMELKGPPLFPTIVRVKFRKLKETRDGKEDTQNKVRVGGISFSTKQNSISIGQKIHTKFHHHYKNTKTTLKRK